MKAIVWTKYRSPDGLQLQEVAKPTPKDKEVLIRICATIITAGDCELRSFRFPLKASVMTTNAHRDDIIDSEQRLAGPGKRAWVAAP